MGLHRANFLPAWVFWGYALPAKCCTVSFFPCLTYISPIIIYVFRLGPWHSGVFQAGWGRNAGVRISMYRQRSRRLPSRHPYTYTGLAAIRASGALLALYWPLSGQPGGHCGDFMDTDQQETRLMTWTLGVCTIAHVYKALRINPAWNDYVYSKADNGHLACKWHAGGYRYM
jgi:hypothetical protein